MEQKKNTAIRLTVPILILCLGCLIRVGYELVDTVMNTDGDGLSGIFYIIAILSAAVYSFYGYKKNASVYYKLTAGCFALGMFLGVLPALNGETPPLEWALGGIRLATAVLLAVLSFGKNLGKKKSFALCAAVGVFSLAFAVVYGIGYHAFIGTAAANFLLTAVLFLMIIAKYKDKKTRGKDI